MEVLEIQSAHSLITSMPGNRPDGAHTYKVQCRQFTLVYKDWQKRDAALRHSLPVMCLGFERIWLTAQEAEQVVSAIRSNISPITLG
jgi:hypothetical protein